MHPTTSTLLSLVFFVTTFFTFTTASLSLQPDALVRKDDHTASSALVYGVSGGNLTFAITGIKSNGDIYFHMAAPSSYSWVAVGTGSEMDGSVMLMGYASSDGKGVTLSPRTATGNVEPSYSSKFQCSIVTGAGVSNGVVNKTLLLNGHCANFTAASGMKLSLLNPSQPFIFALGTEVHNLQSNSMSANIRRHTEYGTFTMDMGKASVQNGDGVTVPTGMSVWMNANAAVSGKVKTGDQDWIGPVHSVAMCGAFVLMYPLGVVFLRVLEKVGWHAGVQGAATLSIIIGVGLGIYLSLMYNHSKSYTSLHQILGLALLLACLLQFTLGYLHHRAYARTGRPTRFGLIHRFAGPVVIVLGAVNGFLGFNFADAPNHNLFYGILVGVVFLVVGGLVIWARMRRERREKARTRDEFGLPGYEGMRGEGLAQRGGVGFEGSASDVDLGGMALKYGDYGRATPRPMI